MSRRENSGLIDQGSPSTPTTTEVQLCVLTSKLLASGVNGRCSTESSGRLVEDWQGIIVARPTPLMPCAMRGRETERGSQAGVQALARHPIRW